jgi:RHS repeat-associated protein
MDAFGNITEYTQNDGAVTNYKVYDPLTGYISDIQADNGFLIQDNDYTFDAIGNLRTRTRNSLDANYSKRSETFKYDTLNRLTDINNVEQVRYQANGNIDWKVDVNNGSASYYCYNAARPHAVSGMGSQGCTTQSYAYDANGNMTSGRGRNITYGHFDKPTLISNAAGSTAFDYDLSRKRYKRETTENSVTTKTYYVGNVEFVYKDNVFSETRRYLPDAIQTRYRSGAIKTRYLHKDHLGSIDSMTDDNGKLIEKLYFDAWGKKESIALGSWDGINSAFRATTLAGVLDINTVTPRGFTGHEHIDHADIIHMNGRIYDPVLGRFLQADPNIQAPSNSQSYTRYSYVLNNPLSYTDPSGFFFSKLWKKIKPFISVIIVAVASVYCAGTCTAGVGAAIGVAAGGVGAAVNGGNILEGALIGAFTAGASTYGMAAAAIAGGVASKVQGGNFGHGFWAAGLGAGIGGGSGQGFIKVITAAIVGGTISKLTGVSLRMVRLVRLLLLL